MQGTRSHAIRIKGGTANHVISCRILNVGQSGVQVKGGTDHAVIACDISLTGEGGVLLDGGDADTLTPGRNRVENSHIHTLSRWIRCYRVPITVTGVGNIVRNNRIHDVTHTGIIVKGNDHLIERNHIFDVSLETEDNAPIYVGGEMNIAQQGSIIRENYLHDSDASTGDPLYHHGIYSDNMQSGLLIEGNIIMRVPNAIISGFGHANRIQNNIIIDTQGSILCSSVEVTKTWSSELADLNWSTTYLKPVFDGFLLDKPVYFERYPVLNALRTLADQGLEASTLGLEVQRNVIVNSPPIDLQKIDILKNTVTNNLTNTDPLFKNPSKGDYKFKSHSPALKIAVPQPPLLSEIGLQIDQNRRALPSVDCLRSHLTIEKIPVVGNLANSQPGIIRVDLTNIGDKTVSGILRPWLAPAAAGEVLGGGIEYRVKPGQTHSYRFEFLIQNPYPKMIVGESREGEFFSRRFIKTPITHESLVKHLRADVSIEQLKDLMHDLPGWTIYKNGRALADFKMALSGQNMALYMRVKDVRISRPKEFWNGSCIQIYFSRDNTPQDIQQFVFLPKIKGMPAQFLGFSGGIPQTPSSLPYKINHLPNGYSLSALIPLSSLNMQDADLLKFEVDVTVGLMPSGTISGSLFGSQGAYNNSSRFSTVRFELPRH